MISPDDLYDDNEKLEQLGYLLAKWADEGLKPNNILAILHSAYIRTFAATSGNEEEFGRLYTDFARKKMWDQVLKNRALLKEVLGDIG